MTTSTNNSSCAVATLHVKKNCFERFKLSSVIKIFFKVFFLTFSFKSYKNKVLQEIW